MTLTYIQHTPSPPLNEYVNSFYWLSGRMPSLRERIVPLPTFDLKINFGDSVQMQEPDYPERPASFNESWCVGVWSVCHTVNWPLDMQILGVNLKSFGAWMLFKLPLYELHNQVVTLDTLWGHFAAEIRERLYTMPTVQARFELLEQLLLAHLEHTLKDLRLQLAEEGVAGSLAPVRPAVPGGSARGADGKKKTAVRRRRSVPHSR